ncbi:receptor kinase-like protein Xa21 [Asparagus officinalis]|uniref:receptor kinase-like protein Xa21 n=1 Tax=Asparagus officinalis TaxID=4686 RepID=UPI00098E7D13|nr:receptor kinase-like protein Xa21 [Asparagus officinalis]
MLQFLSVSDNRLTGGIPSSLSHFHHLQVLALSVNGFSGRIPPEIGKLQQLRLLALGKKQSHRREQANMRDGVSRLTVELLWSLDMGNNELAGIIPSEIGMLENLQSLILNNNRLHGSIPWELGGLKRLSKLSLEANSLSGFTPDSLGNISGLQHLLLGANELSARIPKTIWSLTGLIELNLSRNILNGSLPLRMGNIKSLDILDMSMNQLSGNILSAFKELQMLRYLDLSDNSFDGLIPQSLSELISIEALNLSHNNLSGIIPNSLVNLQYLRSMDLSFNKLTGNVPDGGVFSNLIVASVLGNAALCGAPRIGFPPCTTNDVSPSSATRALLFNYVLPAAAITVISFAFCYMVLIFFFRRQTNNQAPSDTPSLDSHRSISCHQLVRATENFSEANLLGRVSFGSVYKGCLDDGLIIAVKVLNLEVQGALRSFNVECHALIVVRHRNLVKIISTCSQLKFRALVLQFMPNGSLERWLYSHTYCLNLLERINIAIDVASALEYLHHHYSQIVLHCDLKPSNVVMNEDMTAHVADFGIAKVLVGDSWTVTSTSKRGTIGHMAPGFKTAKLKA